MIDGFLYRLREVNLSDARFIVNLRNNEDLNRYINTTSDSLELQQVWLKDYFKRSNDYYFIVENINSLEREGLISLYDINIINNEGEWGRWIIKPGSISSIESAFLIYKFGFEHMKLQRIYCRTIAENSNVINFHDGYGANRVRKHKNYLNKNGTFYTAIEHEIFLDKWYNEVQTYLQRKALRIAKKF